MNNQPKNNPQDDEVASIIKTLTQALRGKNPELVKKFIAWGLQQIPADKLQQAIQEWTDPAPILFNHFKLNHPAIRPLARTLFRMYWNEIEEHLTDARKIYDILTQRQDLKPILDTPRARAYLNWLTQRFYDILYDFVWGV